MRHLRFTALVLTLAMLLGLFPAAMAEDAEVFSAPVEESVGEAVDFGDTGLVSESEAVPLEAPVAIPEAELSDLTGEAPVETYEVSAPEAWEGDFGISAPSTVNNFTVDNGSLLGWTGTDTALVIPESLGVTVIGPASFKDHATLQSVSLPNGVVTIAENAFAGCAALKSIVLPASLQTIGAKAFDGCSALETITIPKGTTSIDATAFSACPGLKSIGVYANSPALKYCTDYSIAYTLVEEVPVQGVQLSKVSHSMKIGETWQLTATVLPANATNSAVSWSSSDTSVVTVTAGAVKALKEGSAIITAASAADSSKTAICTVTVTKGVDVANIILSQSTLTLTAGASATLTAAVQPANATNTNVVWASSNTAIATVKDGVVTAVAPGTVTVTVASATKTAIAASCVVTVIESGVAVTGVYLDQSTLSLMEGESFKLNATVQPENAANTGVLWSSSDPAVASIVGGVITARKAGSTIISIASAADATKTAVCSVTVSGGTAVTEVHLSQETLTLIVNGSAALSTLVLPADAANKKLVWASSDASVATVAGGVITALKPGTATITATSASNNDRSASCVVTVVAEPVAVTGVTLDQFMLSLKAGEQWKLTPTVLPANASNTAVTWTSSDPTVASVVGGVVTALKQGEATITIASVLDPTKTAACVVSVVNAVAVTSVSLDKAELALNSGESATLTAAVLPAEATNKNVIWSSSNASIATVSKTGVVTAYAPGKVTITATSVANVAAYASCTVTVIDPNPVKAIYLSQSTLTLNVGATATLTTVVTPEDASNKVLVWTSSDNDVAAVKDGVITARKEGKATITVASSSNPATAVTCAVTVTKDIVAVTGVAMDQANITLNAGDTKKLSASVLPENASNTAVTWASSDTTVVSVNSGVVTALKPGTATVFASSVADPSKAATCVVTVPVGTPVNQVLLSQSVLALTPGNQATLTAAVLPANATNKRIAWSSNAPEVATVKDGVVTAVKAGVAVISANALSDANIAADCTVYVTEGNVAVTGIVLSKNSLAMTTGDIYKLDTTLYPADATNTALVWASSDTSVATVSGGVVSAIKAGTAIISVTSASGAVRSACTVTVNNPVAVGSITLPNTELTLSLGQTYKLTPAILPENAADKSIVWSSSNPRMVDVKDGVITAVGIGAALVTAASVSNPAVTAGCVVTVINAIPVEAVTISQTELAMDVGQTFQLYAAAWPEAATDRTIGWLTDNPAVATIKDGVVTAVGGGQTAVYAYSLANNTKWVGCVVKVRSANQAVLSRTGSNGTVTVGVGEQLQLVPQFATVNRWYVTSIDTSKAKVAAVDGAGLVTAVSEGTTTVTMRTANGRKAKIKVKVVDPYRPYAVGIVQGKKLVMRVGQTLQLDAVLAPSTARTSLSWTSSKTKRATVSPTGLVTALSKGSVKIYVRTANGKKAKIKITVVN